MNPRNATGTETYPFKDISEKVIGAALEVHKVLGNGFLEAVYNEAFAYELHLHGVAFEAEKALDIRYKDQVLGKKYFCDFVVADAVIVELKATAGLGLNDEAQLLHYLKATGKKVGLLLNFGTPSLEIKRRIN